LPKTPFALSIEENLAGAGQTEETAVSLRIVEHVRAEDGMPIEHL